MDTIRIDGRSLTLEMLARAAAGEIRMQLDSAARRDVAASREALERLMADGVPVYGANTGFGLMSEVRIPDENAILLQENLIRSHCAGVGEPLPPTVVRIMIALRANVLARGHSGVRVELVESLLDMLNSDVLPVIPSRGSVGASGDLAPLAHLALVLMGEGEATRAGRRMQAGEALASAGLRPIRLAAKEGLALVNGTQTMTALGVLSLLAAERSLTHADIACAMTVDGLLGSAKPFDERLAALRPHPGHMACASNIRALLDKSELMASHRACGKVQDSYSLRCAPQVHGAVRDGLAYVRRVLETEVNAVTDNPIFYPETGEALSGGNFHGAPVAQAMDLLCLSLADAASISERRTERLTNPSMSGLPAFLAGSPGLESGVMMAQVTAAALTSESKILSHPGSVDSIPTGGGKEDHVSMGVTSALKAARVVEILETVLAIELMSAALAIDIRRPLRSSPALEAAHAAIRRKVPELKGDRVLSGDIEAMVALLRDGAIRRAAETVTGPLQ